MRVLAAHKVEDCFDGSAVFDYELSEPWTDGLIRALASLGTLDYFPQFPRPFFRVKTDRGIFMKGLAGASRCRVILPRTNQPQIQRHLENTLERLSPNREPGATAPTQQE